MPAVLSRDQQVDGNEGKDQGVQLQALSAVGFASGAPASAMSLSH
jgi:hypothetical protein